jgi:hypothetical protein
MFNPNPRKYVVLPPPNLGLAGSMLNTHMLGSCSDCPIMSRGIRLQLKLSARLHFRPYLS